MNNGIHFISGLPRSGSTLLAALLRQNPRVHAAMTSPVGSLVNALLRQMSQENEAAVFIDDIQRRAILRACVKAYYADVHPTRLVFDTNRQWTAKAATLAALYPKAKIVCCVRNPAWVLDSLERLTRRNALEPSRIFSFDPGGTVYSRADALMGAAGLVGFAHSALREAIWGSWPERLLLVRFESLTANPGETLATIYEFIGEPAVVHDPNNIEQDFDALEFDARLGAPGLHTVQSKVRQVTRRTILPPDLFRKYEVEAFWERKGELPDAIRVV